MTGRSRIPDTGDIAWLDFSPRTGHEQGGYRPAVVLTPARYNGRTSTMICCPMSSQVKGYPFEVVVSRNPPSVILADQIKSFDWRARRATPKGRVTESVLAELRAKIHALIGA